MTDNDKCCPPPKDVQDFLFKQEGVGQVCEEFQNIPIASSLIAADGKRGLLYIGHENQLFIVKPGSDSNPEWKLECNLPDKVCRIELSCDCSFLAVTFGQPSAVIYDLSSVNKHKLDILHKIRLSASAGNITVSDLKWNPAIPEMLCSITSDHTIGCFQVGRDKKAGVHVLGMEKPANLEALCVSWSPKGKQLVVGCKNGDIVQLKPELKIARHLSGPKPSEGVIISMLWISNYQFCACYFHADEQRISVMIVDAPKGVTTPKFTNYEDITFGSGSMDGLCYYFEYIAEWGVIIVGSTHSSEIAVLGTSDNGATWSQWQLMEGGVVQLPLNRKKKTENYPVGIAIDKSSNQKLPWGTDSFLPNPVPILRILVTSGQLCCYHIVNLKENAPAICSPASERVPVPSQPRPSLGPSEVSFNLHSGATSTPQKQAAAAAATAAATATAVTSTLQVDKTKVATNMFGETASSNFSFLGNKDTSENMAENQMKNTGFAAQADMNMTAYFGGPADGKSITFQQANTASRAFACAPTTQAAQQTKQAMPSSVQQAVAQLESKPSGLSTQANNKSDAKPVSPAVAAAAAAAAVAAAQAVMTQAPKESQAKEAAAQHRADETSKAPVKQAPLYDDKIYLQAFHEEQARFEKELKSKLELPSWNCGSEQERQLLIKRTDEIEEFLKELRETTNSLASDIAYLKALLLQSFAWIEETKSKSSSNGALAGRSRASSEAGKLAELQRLYYYTQSQLLQATKVLDLHWADHQSRELSKMKIPSLEVIYQSLIKHSQIIGQEKKNMDSLTKKWRAIARGSVGGGGCCSGNNADSTSAALSNLDRSMSALNLSNHSSNGLTLNADSAISLRCKLIASNSRNLSREKQLKLRDLLAETEPKIVLAVRPTAIQDRLEATLSSLAALKANSSEASGKSRTGRATQQCPSQPMPSSVGVGGGGGPTSLLPESLNQAKPAVGQPPSLNPLSSLDNLVAGFGPRSPGDESPSSSAQFSALSVKPTFATQPQKPTENTPLPARNAAGQALGTPGSRAFNFAVPGQKTQPEPTKAAPSSAGAAFGKLASASSETTAGSGSNGAAPKSSFGFGAATSASPVFAALPRLDNASVFKFSTKTGGGGSPSTGAQSNLPSPMPALDLSGLNFGARTSTAAPASGIGAPAPNFSFGKTSSASQPQNSLFGQMVAASAGNAGAGTAPASAAQLPPGKTGSAAAPSTSPTTAVAASSSIFAGSGGGATMFGSLSITPVSGSAVAATTSTAKTEQPAVSTSSLSSTPSFADLLGSTASLGFGGSSTTTSASSILPSFGNAFGISTPAQTKADPSTTNSSSSSGGGSGQLSQTTTMPFGSSTTTATTTTTSATSIFGSSSPASSSSTSIFGGQTTTTTTVVSSSSSNSNTGNSFFGTKSSTATTTASTGSIFGSTAASPMSSGTSIFGGSSSATTAFASSASTQPSSVFGATTVTTQSSGTSIFGAATNTSQSAGTSVFGSTSSTTQSATGSLFGNVSSTASTAGSLFGTTSPAQSNSGTSIFGTRTTQSSGSSIFGGGTQSPATGQFGAITAAASPVFGTTSAPAATATTTASSSIFGSSPFGGTPAGNSVFGAGATPSTASIFNAPAATTSPSLFGAATAAAPAATTTTTATSSMFGSPVPAAAAAAATAAAAAATATPATTTSGGSIFGTASPQATASVFGAASTSPAAGGSVFGGPATLGAGTSMFGGAAAPSMFGQSTAFGAKSVFGAPAATFGTTGFGSPPAFGAAASPGFGGSPIMGGSAPIGSTSPGKVFGSSTFEALGAQTGGLSFGSLAQKTPEQQKPQAFQGSSSFSSWR